MLGVLPLLIIVAGLATVVFAISGRRIPGAEPAIAAYLGRRGQRLISIEPLVLGGRHPRTGLSWEAVIYRVRAEDPDGTPRAYEWAYDPTRSQSGEKGVYRWSTTGGWIPES